MTVIVPSRPARPIRVDGGGRIPPGGTSGQALVKSSNNDYATEWGTAAAAAAWGSITGTLASQTDLAAALSAKQDTLVSGANIKTLNGSTILGSGDLVISASAAWGGITGTLSDQTDLNTALGLKANTSSLAAVATSGSASDLGAGTLPTARLPAFGSGDVSFASGGGAGTIAADAVTNAKLANVATATIKGRATAGTGDPEDLTGTEATALLDAFVGSGTGHAKGLVPDPGATPGINKFLCEDGTWKTAGGGGTECLIVAVGDEITALAAGTAKVTFRMPYAFTLTAVRASLTIAQSAGSIFTVDINEGGSSILSTKLTIDNTEKTSTTAATQPVVSDASLADDAEITFDIDQIGNGTAVGLKVYLIGHQ